jgi:glycosyltransferase involved in cell wall biosynthesis
VSELVTHEAPAGRSTIRVLSVPSGHVYVDHLAHPAGPDGVLRLPDPSVGPGVPATRWWPPPALEAGWVRAHADDFDLVHLHFGFDDRTPDQLREWVTALRTLGRPLVFTVHDLRNPHHLDRTAHDAQLDVLVPAADVLLTLTPGAAEEVRRRWGRTCVVVPHPHVVEEPWLSRPRPVHDDLVVGVHLKSLRANLDARPVVEALVDAVAGLPETRLVVDVHREAMAPGFVRHDAGLTSYLRAAADRGDLTLREHDFFTDEELWDYLQGLDLSVLPYRFGTHSGWLEACFDLGTPVLTSDRGYYAEQRPCLTYRRPDGPDGEPDAASLTAGVRRAWEERPSWRADPGDRRRERVDLARVHRGVYERVLAP